MALAYFDCFAGAGGDMIVAALLDAGCDAEGLRSRLSAVAGGCGLRTEQANRGGMVGTRFVVEPPDEPQPHRRLADILAMIDAAGLDARAARRARRIFTRLGEAEAKVHHTDLENVHFHEVGALDSIMDIVGAAAALEMLGVERVLCSPLPLGGGTVQAAHGLMPLPAPATAELLVGAKTCPGTGRGELVTPTAASVLTTLAESYGPPPAMRLSAVGYGAGTRDEGPLPNLLRVLVGEPDADADADAVVELSANLDDCSGEVLGAAIERLLAGGALDAWASPIVMKRSRPAWTVSALCAPADADAVEGILFAETTTFGVRRSPRTRARLARSRHTVETPYGPIRIKVGRRAGRVVTAQPEFADCLAAAEAHHAAVRQVMAAARQAFSPEDAR
jgi:hypothetical protein